MQSETWVKKFSTGEIERYSPPPEIKMLLSENPVFRRIAEVIGVNPALQKLWGNIFGSKKFSENLIRRRHGNGLREPLLPTDGYLTRSEISRDGMSTVLGKIPVDIRKMLGLTAAEMELDVPHQKIFDAQYAMRTRTEMAEKYEHFVGGQHDLAILKPQHKHSCSVPIQSELLRSYRVGRDGHIFEANIGQHRIPHEKVYSTDPEVALQNADRLSIFDGNQRMIFVLRTTELDDPIEYIEVAHSAAFVAGIEPVARPGTVIAPGEVLFKFHQGSSVSVLWPKNFHEQFVSVPDAAVWTVKNHVLEVLEGQKIYEKVSSTGQ